MSKKLTEIRPINTKNFPEAVQYAKEFNLLTTRHLRIRAIALPIGCISFLLLSLFFTFGFLTAEISPFNTFIPEKLPFISKFWGEFMGWCDDISSNWYIKAIICILLLYLIPFAITSLLALSVKLLTRVPKPSLNGDHVNQVNQLYEYCLKIPCSKKQNRKINTVWCRVIAACFTLLLVACEIYVNISTNSMMLFLYLAIPIYFLFGLITRLFVLSVKHYYSKAYIDTLLENVPYTYVVSEYRAKVDPVIRKRIEDNERAERAKREREEREKKQLEAKLAEAIVNGWEPPNPEEPKPYSAMDDDVDLPKIDVSDM